MSNYINTNLLTVAYMESDPADGPMALPGVGRFPSREAPALLSRYLLHFLANQAILDRPENRPFPVFSVGIANKRTSAPINTHNHQRKSHHGQFVCRVPRGGGAAY